MSDIVTSPRPSRFGQALGFRLVGLGSAVPDEVVTNADLAHLGCDPQWILERSGIRERRHAPPWMATADLAAAAGRDLLARTAVPPTDIDLLLLGTFTPDHSIPSTACIVQESLGLNAPAMDITAACAGFVYALITGAQFLAAGSSREVMVIGADTNSRVVDPDDVKTWPLFGDGAGAVLLERVEPEAGGRDRGLLSFSLGSDGRGAGLLVCPMSGSRQPPSAEGLARREQYMRMDGRSVFKWAIRVTEENIRAVVERAGLSLDDIDCFILHQANLRIIEGVRGALAVAGERFAINIDRYGNTSSASIPLAMDEAWREGRIGAGSTVVVCGFGGGLAWGSAVWRL
ncbi:MAG: ketoacyl-ACP synthase III [Planctomycetota bacterium]|nr:MAG: ketoacyl-ACP synthase III [Planctomycetota bacterium]